MTRGNQRELARAKNAKKQAETGKGRNDDGLTPQQRRERDKAALEAKAAKKAEQKAGPAGGGGKK